MKSGNLNFLEPSGPLQACNETALPLLLHEASVEPSRMLWKVEGFFFYFLLFVGQQREFTREKRRMTVFVLMVNFLTYLVTYYVEQVQVNVLNSVKTFSFPVGHYQNCCVLALLYMSFFVRVEFAPLRN